MPVRRVAGRLLAPFALLLALASPAAGQGSADERSIAPARGTWGVETRVRRFDDASVMRFLSPGWAVMIGGAIASRTDGGTPGAGFTDVSLHAGIRKYHRSGLGLRPITGAGLTAGRTEGLGDNVGVFGEAGAVYLFNRHISVGAVGLAEFSRDGPQNTYTLLAPRLIASVFF